MTRLERWRKAMQSRRDKSLLAEREERFDDELHHYRKAMRIANLINRLNGREARR